ncbi:amidoligase family protein, partial [Ruthenibacterium lactatiformans]
QEIVRALRRNNALVNDSCGIHVHVGAEKFDAQHLRNITNIMASKEELIYKALQVDLNRSQDYCRRVEQRFLRQVNEQKPQSLDRF